MQKRRRRQDDYKYIIIVLGLDRQHPALFAFSLVYVVKFLIVLQRFPVLTHAVHGYPCRVVSKPFHLVPPRPLARKCQEMVVTHLVWKKWTDSGNIKLERICLICLPSWVRMYKIETDFGIVLFIASMSWLVLILTSPKNNESEKKILRSNEKGANLSHLCCTV